jgi:hypothetical protein
VDQVAVLVAVVDHPEVVALAVKVKILSGLSATQFTAALLDLQTLM